METYKDYEIFDTHTHIYPSKIVESATESIGHFYDIRMRNVGSSERLIESGGQIGVSKYLVCSVATTPKQVGSINRFIAKECEEHPEFIGFGAAHPLAEDMHADIRQIRMLGLKGIKLHPDFQKFAMDSKEMYRIYEEAEGVLPILIHFGDDRYDYSRPQKMENIHRDFPDLQIIASHLGGYHRWEEAQACLVGMDNVWFDTCSSLMFMSAEEGAKKIRNLGIDRCFFATDFPMWRHTTEFQKFLDLGFTHEENQMIFSDNFKRFMNIV